MNEHFQKVTIRNKIREVIELLKEKSHNKITNEKLSSIEESVANWIAHPIFTREESLVASAIFAH